MIGKRHLLTTAIVAALAIMLALGGCGSSDGAEGSVEPDVTWPAMDVLRSLSAEDISAIEYVRATEGGVVVGGTEDDATVEDIYLRLKDVDITGSSKMGVDDDSLSIKVAAGSTSLSFSFEGDILVLEDGGRYEVANLSSLKSYVDRLIKEGEPQESETDEPADVDDASNGTPEADAASEPADTPEAGATDAPSNDDAITSSTQSQTGSYDVSAGFQSMSPGDGIVYLYFNDFMLVMPDNQKYSFEMEGDAVTFYLFSAQQEGYGGRLVTIKAFDMDDHSYENMPMEYHVAGVGHNVNKRFVAIYPSDLQCNPQDSEQLDDYRELLDYLRKIGEGAVNSPLQTSDGD